jgi:hypothetical protein
MFARPQAKPRLGLSGSGVALMLPLDKYLCKNPCSTFYLKRLVREKLSLVLPVGLVTFHLAFES